MRMFWQRNNVIWPALLILGLSWTVPAAGDAEVVTIPEPGKPLPFFRNSHATAMA